MSVSQRLAGKPLSPSHPDREEQELYRDAAAHARKMPQDRGALLILDAVRVDANPPVLETFSMPLLSVVPEEDSTRFFESMCQLVAWHIELAAFWRHALAREVS